MLQYLVLLGAAVYLVSNIFYIRETLKGKTKPNRVSWFLWGVIPMVAVLASLSEGVTWAVVPVFMSGFGPLLVFLASFVNSKAYWKLERLDYICGIFALFAILFWILTKNPNVAIAFAILADTFASIPTLKKMWHHPQTETITPYCGAFFSALTSFFAIKISNFSSLAFPIYLLVMALSFILIFYTKKIFRPVFKN